MKILLVANINSTHTKKWALALKERKLKVAIFSLNTVIQNDDWFKVLDHVYYPTEKKSFFLNYLNLYSELKKLIGVFNPDIVHSHFITNYSLIVNLLGVKNHVVTAWGSDVFLFPKQNLLNKCIVKYNLSKAKVIISTSHVMAQELGSYTSKPIHVIPFGVDFTQFQTFDKQIELKKFNIGYFKKIESVYGTDLLIKAFKIVCDNLPDYDLKLTLAGDGSQLEEMKRLAFDLDPASNIIFLGWVDPKNVPNLLQKTDICVYLSRRESFGVSLVEAMAARVPLVVSQAQGFLEVAGEGDNVLFADVNNVEQAAEQLIKLITDRTLYEEIRKRAYVHALKKYSLASNISEQIKLYEALLNGSDANY